MLRGERVVLRAIERADVADLHTWARDPAVWPLTSDDPWTPKTVADSEKQYDEGERYRADDKNVPFAVDVDGRLVGQVSLWAVDHLSRRGSLGIYLGPDARGQGYGRDAVAVLLRYAFEHRGLHRVALEVLADNEPAIRCYRACGFVEEGRLRDDAWVDGRYVDMLRMGVLSTDPR